MQEIKNTRQNQVFPDQMSNEDITSGMLTAARILEDQGQGESALQLLKYAFDQGPSRTLAKTAFWVGLRGNDIAFCTSCLDFVESQPDALDTKWMTGKREKLGGTSGPTYKETISKLVRDSRADSYRPIDGTLCYVLHNSLPFSSGGYATRAHGMALGLKDQGLEVACITRPGYPTDLTGVDPAEVPSQEAIDSISYQRIRAPSRHDFPEKEYIFSAAIKIAESLLKLRPAYVMAASNYVTSLASLIAAKNLGIPFFYEVRGFWEITRISREPEFEETRSFRHQVLMETLVASHADHVFTLTSPMKEELIARGVAPEKITLAPNSCDPFRFTPRPRDTALAAKYDIPSGVPVIGYIGTFVQYEGLEHLAQACSLLRAQGLDFRLLLVGNENASGQERGPITEEILRVAQEEGLSDKLIMPGRIPHDEVEAHYSLIDIAPFPRKPQPVTEMVSPMKPLEALAMEKAVVVSSVRALTEMIKDCETGMVFEKGDVEDMARVLSLLIKDPDLRLRLGKTGRKWVEDERTWNKTAGTVAKMAKTFVR